MERSARSATVFGVEGKKGRSLQQKTFEKRERGARERRKSVWSTGEKRVMMSQKELTALSQIAVSGRLRRRRKRWHMSVTLSAPRRAGKRESCSDVKKSSPSSPSALGLSVS